MLLDGVQTRAEAARRAAEQLFGQMKQKCEEGLPVEAENASMALAGLCQVGAQVEGSEPSAFIHSGAPSLDTCVGGMLMSAWIGSGGFSSDMLLRLRALPNFCVVPLSGPVMVLLSSRLHSMQSKGWDRQIA